MHILLPMFFALPSAKEGLKERGLALLRHPIANRY
jgi:hypothetical protein